MAANEPEAMETDTTLKDQLPPLGSFSLANLKKYAYVDKTNLLGKIMEHKERYIFAPSMRRCGKSITIVLLKAMAEGKRDALDGMAICGEASAWNLPAEETYTVVCLDFSQISTFDTFGRTEERMARYLFRSASSAGINVPSLFSSPTEILQHWIQEAAKGRPNNVVVLIDEYDALLTPFLADPEKLERNATVLKEVFVCLKSMDKFIFKAFVTGGLKAGMAGLFSGANNFYRLMDMEAEYATIFGFTEKQLLETYAEHITEFFPGSSLQDSLGLIKSYYNGYRFHPGQEDTIFNPFSVISYLHAGRTGKYWAFTYSSGVGQLANLLLRHGADALRSCRISWERLQLPVDKNGLIDDWQSILFQSGYLTIWEHDGDDVILGPPNAEVTEYLAFELARILEGEAISQGLMPSAVMYSGHMSKFEFDKAADMLTAMVNNLKYALVNENEFAGWALHLLRLFASRDDGRKSDFECVFTEISQRIETDAASEKAKRLDGALVVNRNGVKSAIIVELKFNKTAQEAYDQITDRNYVTRCKQYLTNQLQITVADGDWHSVGFNLSNVPKKVVTCVHSHKTNQKLGTLVSADEAVSARLF